MPRKQGIRFERPKRSRPRASSRNFDSARYAFRRTASRRSQASRRCRPRPYQGVISGHQLDPRRLAIARPMARTSEIRRSSYSNSRSCPNRPPHPDATLRGTHRVEVSGGPYRRPALQNSLADTSGVSQIERRVLRFHGASGLKVSKLTAFFPEILRRARIGRQPGWRRCRRSPSFQVASTDTLTI